MEASSAPDPCPRWLAKPDPLKGIDGDHPKDLFPWHFNLCRQRGRGGDIERAAYSPAGKDDFSVVEKVAKLWRN